MKKLFFFLLAALSFSACSDDSGIFTPDPNGIKEPKLPVDTISNEKMLDATKVFDKLNLDYPGLERVKAYYEANEYYMAANELLTYYRNRGNILNPKVNLVNPNASETDFNKADQALKDYRFCVAKYVEKKADNGLDVYYSFKKDGKINWGFKPDKTDREFLYQQHRHQWMEPQAKAYATSRNENYIKSWIEVYTDWMKTYPCPNAAFPEGEKEIIDTEAGYEWKGLQPTERVLSQTNIIQYYLSSPNFTPQWLGIVLNAYAESVEMIRMNYYKEGNIRITQGYAVAAAGILMPEFKNAETWITEGLATMNMDEQFRADGVHCDLDFSYHVAAISDYLQLYEIAKANNRLSALPADYISKLENAIHFVQHMIYPDYTIDNFNDTRSSSYAKSTLMNRLKDYLKVFPQNQELKWLAWEGSKGGVKPSWRLKTYENSGYYIMRSKEWNSRQSSPEGMQFIFKNNENSAQKWHCQPDNGTFSFWYNGTNFLPDAGSYSYDHGTTARNTYRQSTIHNTMSIENSNISESRQLGKFISKAEERDYTVVVTENSPYQAGKKVGSVTLKGDITHRRALFMVNNEFGVVVDEVFSNSNADAAKVNFNYHLLNGGTQASTEGNTVTTNMEANNLTIQAFSETNAKVIIDNSKIDKDVAVSVKPAETVGEKRDWIIINEDLQAGKAVRMITVLYPSKGKATSKKIEAAFKDNTPETAGMLHDLVQLEVKIDGKAYSLKYTTK